jgi:hypothetical protein
MGCLNPWFEGGGHAGQHLSPIEHPNRDHHAADGGQSRFDHDAQLAFREVNPGRRAIWTCTRVCALRSLFRPFRCS